MSAESEVRDASARFYQALTRMAKGESDTMEGIWAQDSDASTMHPIGGREKGWEEVEASFNGVAAAAQGGSVRLEDQRIVVAGDVAWETGTERGKIDLAGHHVDVDGRVTNVYRRRSDGWKLVHHHADASSAMIDVVRKLQAAN